MKHNLSLILRVHPLQGLAESLILGLLILAISARLEGYVQTYVFQNALFFLAGVCGIWAVLRIRFAQTGWLLQTLLEMATAVALSLLMLFALRALGTLLHLDAVWRLTNWQAWQIIAVLGSTGPGYFLARGLVKLWQRWNMLRRRRMLWSLTNAHLTIVVFIAFLAALGVFLLIPQSDTAVKVWAQTKDPLASFATGVIVALFPAVTFISIFTVLTLLIMLPPLALFSYWVARRTTRRLEALAATTAALHNGDYQARVPVEGEDEVAQLQADFNAMAEKLESTLADLKTQRDTVSQMLQARRELIASVSHELRTPVATLRAAIETTLKKWQKTPPAIARQNLEVMGAEIQRLSGLIDDLFTLAQADVANLSLACAPLELYPLVQQVVKNFTPLAWNSGRVEVSASLPDGLPPVMADANRLQQVLLNLLRNAVRHTPPGGIVAILAGSEEEFVRIEVRDTGEGIAAEELPHIWERFYRGQNASADSAGLGLALVKDLVEAMDGSVGVESVFGQGSCFTIRLRKVLA